MKFAVAIETGNEQFAYGVVVPDLPGVFSSGETLEGALENAKEAILFGLEDRAERGEPLITPTELAWLMVGIDGKGGRKNFPSSKWAWHVVDVDITKLTAKAVRVNITLPEPLLNAIDTYVSTHQGESRSGFLARAAQSVLNR